MLTNNKTIGHLFKTVILIINIVVRAIAKTRHFINGIYLLLKNELTLGRHKADLSMKFRNFCKAIIVEKIFCNQLIGELFKIDGMNFEVHNLVELLKQREVFKNLVKNLFLSKFTVNKVESSREGSHLYRRIETASLGVMDFFKEAIKSLCALDVKVRISFFFYIDSFQKCSPFMVPDLSFSVLNSSDFRLRKVKKLRHLLLGEFKVFSYGKEERRFIVNHNS